MGIANWSCFRNHYQRRSFWKMGSALSLLIISGCKSIERYELLRSFAVQSGVRPDRPCSLHVFNVEYFKYSCESRTRCFQSPAQKPAITNMKKCLTKLQKIAKGEYGGSTATKDRLKIIILVQIDLQ